MLKTFFRPLMAALVLIGSSSAFTASAADDPSLHAIYEAANSGKLAAAQDMIDTVLKDHPDSGKAHYVAAELDARQGKLAAAREQLQSAEKLAPGLPFARPESVRALRAQLGQPGATANTAGSLSALTPRPMIPAPQASSGLSPGLLIGIVAVIGFIAWMIFRRRPAPQYPQAYPANSGGYGNGYGGPGGVGYPQQGMPGGGIGSGIAGGLASGLAVGAGVVAGEALAHRFMDGGGERERYADGTAERPLADPNGNMGGSDFGINDSSSWDDSGGISDSGGGDDWS
jgi:hypothetical protein